jgi:bacterioferritin-associated ferredoxin
MILCICNNISEQRWRQELEAQAHDVAAASQACGAGQCCGCCQDTLTAVAREAQELLPA